MKAKGAAMLQRFISKYRPHLVLMFMITASFFTQGMAQTTTGTVVGTLVDKSGAFIVGAPVNLTSAATNVTLTTKSDSAGVFRFPAVAVGEYTVLASPSGFDKVVVNNVTVTVGESVNLTLKVNVASQAQTVEVSGSGASVMQTDSSQVQTVVTQRDVENLPLNGRNFIQLEALQPNSVPYQRTSSTANRGGYNVIAGAPVQAAAMTIDGVNVKELLDPRTTILLNLDVMQEFQSASANYSAAQGGAGGAQINLVSKSGSNRFHGSLFEYIRNDKLNARNYFDPRPHANPAYRQNQFGGSFGGPIVRDKLFFYGGYEGLRIVQGLAQFFTVPTMAERQGNFQGEPQIYNPLSYNPATGLRQPFANNIIPSDMLSSVSQKALSILYPEPNVTAGPGGANNLSGSKPNGQTTDQFSVRGDYDPNSKDLYFLRYIYFNPRKVVGANAQLPNFADNQNTPTHSVAFGYIRTLTPQIVNQFRLGYLRFTQILGDVQINVPIDQEIGITGTSPLFLGNPTIGITGFDTTGGISNAPNDRRDNGFYIYDDLLWNRGKHGISMGVTGALEQFNGGQNPNARGNFSFLDQYSDQVGQPKTGFALADFVMGFPATSAVGLGSGFRNWRQGKYGLYVQDDWKMLPRLTVNMGLRYEYTQPQYEVHNDVSGFLNGQIVQLGVNGVPRGLRNPYRKDFEPRLGFSYSLDGNSQTVVRGAYGITFVPLQFLTPAFAMGNNPPNYVAETFVGSTPIPNLTLANGFPSGLGTTSTTLSTISTAFRDPYIQQWNLAVERKIAPDTILEITYLGTKGTRLAYTMNINASPAGPGNIQAKRPYPSYGAISSLNSFATTDYDSGVVKVQRRLNHSVTFLASYTFAKSLAMPDQSLVGDGASSVSVRNPLDPQADRGRDVFDIRHRVAASAVWDLPIGRGQLIGHNWPGYLEQTLGSWRFNAILNLMSGYPLTAALGYDNANTGDSTQDRPDVIGNPNNGPRKVNEWFNTAAFAAPPQYSYGSEGTNIINGPPQKQLDIALSRAWKLYEGVNLQFRGDFFDITNTPQFNQPGSTYGTSTFGVISSAGDPREIQFAAKIVF
jgi:hypothetical protein